jgi:hypothetical protein
MERVLAADVTSLTPGALVELTRLDCFAPHSSAAHKASAMFALENELLGYGIDDAYNHTSGSPNVPANEFVQVEHFAPGDWVLAYVAASATAIFEGDYLESAGDGSLRLVGTDYQEAATAIAQAMESLDNSAGSAIARIKVAIC